MADEQTMTDLKDLGDAVEGTVAPAAPTAPLREKIVDKQGRAYATGRRKDAVARVWVKPGTSKITINGRDQEVYRSEEHTSELQSLLRISYDVFCLQKKK